MTEHAPTSSGGFDPATIAARHAQLQQRIADAGGDLERVKILAVSKALPPDAALAALAAGLVDLGENYAQELVAKAPVVADRAVELGVEPRWHFIGGLQRNKINSLPEISCIHSIDRSSLATALGSRRPGQRVMVQVNIGDEAQKSGCAVGDTATLVGQARDAGLDVVGLMGVARPADDTDTLQQFRTLVGLADELGLPERSIGMSGDLELAVRAGSTMIRVGTALFGPRPPRTAVR